MQPLISVIVPIYNIKPFIRECVESICSQTYENLEIILVDDGSTDGSEKICDEYEQRDSRIKVIHKTNGGLSDARNVALNIFKGEYMTFVDGDDVISPHYIEVLLSILKSRQAQISICGHKDFISLEDIKPNKDLTIKEYSGAEAIKEILINGCFTTSAWAKLYRRDLFDNLRFPVGRLYEDLPTTWQAFCKSEKVVFSPSQVYYYRQNPTSIMNSRFTHKKLDIIYAHESLLMGIRSKHPELVKFVKERFGTYTSIQLFYALVSGYSISDDLKQLRRCIRKNWRNMVGGTYPMKMKLFGSILCVPGVLDFMILVNKCRSKDV
ncbi:MAG: glycosyltransferase [Muribaculaceae bacterium]|nr:glycosyltransferase [Muribaculaceae bacterium]